MTTFNSRPFVAEQLQSLADQDWPHIDLWVSDDGSIDGTRDLLAQWGRDWRKGRFTLFRGPQRGYAENFRSLLAHTEIDADYVAFCDHDDVWLPEKTSSAIAALRPNKIIPALVYSQTILTDRRGKRTGLSRAWTRPPGFANALVQNIASGNTMMLNRPGHHLAREAARRTAFPWHDWFAYLLVSGAGGELVYSDIPGVLYRQHTRNLVGNSTGLGGWTGRWQRRLSLQYQQWISGNLAALESCRDLLTPVSTNTLDRFAAARSASVLHRVSMLRRSGVYRQSASEQFMLLVGSLLNRV